MLRSLVIPAALMSLMACETIDTVQNTVDPQFDSSFNATVDRLSTGQYDFGGTLFTDVNTLTNAATLANVPIITYRGSITEGPTGSSATNGTPTATFSFDVGTLTGPITVVSTGNHNGLQGVATVNGIGEITANLSGFSGVSSLTGPAEGNLRGPNGEQATISYEVSGGGTTITGGGALTRQEF